MYFVDLLLNVRVARFVNLIKEIIKKILDIEIDIILFSF